MVYKTSGSGTQGQQSGKRLYKADVVVVVAAAVVVVVIEVVVVVVVVVVLVVVVVVVAAAVAAVVVAAAARINLPCSLSPFVIGYKRKNWFPIIYITGTYGGSHS
jgi:hypothetical protein